MFKKGDEVVTVPKLWHNGVDIGERLATVLDTRGHILIAIHQYDDNPVKVFRHEIEGLSTSDSLEKLFRDEDINEMIRDFFPNVLDPDDP